MAITAEIKPHHKQKFWERLEHTPEGCWEWTRALTKAGYGAMGLKRGVVETTHRISWRLANGTIPEGMNVLHKCHNRKCCRPEHLYIGTQKDNVRDMLEAGRAGGRKGETHHKAKMTSEQIAEIRQKRAEGQTGTSLAKEYGLAHSGIYRIVNNRGWIVE